MTEEERETLERIGAEFYDIRAQLNVNISKEDTPLMIVAHLCQKMAIAKSKISSLEEFIEQKIEE